MVLFIIACHDSKGTSVQRILLEGNTRNTVPYCHPVDLQGNTFGHGRPFLDIQMSHVQNVS